MLFLEGEDKMQEEGKEKMNQKHQQFKERQRDKEMLFQEVQKDFLVEYLISLLLY